MQLTKLWASRKLYLLAFMVALIGLFDAAYLTYQHYSGSDLICNISHGCEKVLTSKYAVVAGVPVALLGVIYYATVLMVVVHMLTNRPRPRVMLLLGLAGFLPTLYLLFLQAFVIGAWCQYCLLSAMTSTGIFAISIVMNIKTNNLKTKESIDGETA